MSADSLRINDLKTAFLTILNSCVHDSYMQYVIMDTPPADIRFPQRCFGQESAEHFFSLRGSRIELDANDIMHVAYIDG